MGNHFKSNLLNVAPPWLIRIGVGLAVLLGIGHLFAEVVSPTQTSAGTSAEIAPELAMAQIACASNQVAIQFVTGQPEGRHEILESRDLVHWQLAPRAAIQKAGGEGMRASLAGGDESRMFYRALCLGTSPAPAYVSIQVDAELEDTQGLRNLTDELQRRGIGSTIYVTADYANRNAILIANLFRKGFEIALHGYYTGEQLETMTYAEQKDLLTRAKKAVEGCQPCGTYRPVIGFRPQYFSQNEDTFRVLDELGMTHNSGFKVGQIFTPGHAEDAWPYRVNGHLFSAVPITTIPAESDQVYLCDIACAQSLHWSSAQWRQGLMTALTRAIETRQPLVLLLHGWYTGDHAQYQYWQPFIDFLDAAHSRVTYINSTELVNLAAR